MNIDYNSEERYDVEFSPHNSTIEEILSLKTADFLNEKPGQFYIGKEINWDHAILGAFLDVLYYFKERGIQWEEFTVFFYARHQSFTSVLLQTVNGLNIFKEMGLGLFFDDEEDIYSADCEYLFPGINQNKQLEALGIMVGGIHSSRFEDDFAAFISHLREMATLKELRLWDMVHFNEQAFCEYLSENKSLEKLHLIFMYCNDIADEGISNIITSLASHPKLEDLFIRTKDQFGELSSKTIERLLSKTQTLSTLEFNNEGDERGLNAEYILQGLKKNQSLKSLKTTDSLYGDLMLQRFFQILPHCPKLEKLELLEYNIAKNDLEQVIQMDRLQKPIVLEIDVGVTRGNVAVMTKLLRCHPEARLDAYDPNWVFDDNVECIHICQLNWHGRYLIDGSANAPLSLWPLVFENVNDKPSIIYEFLKGPAFAERNDSA